MNKEPERINREATCLGSNTKCQSSETLTPGLHNIPDDCQSSATTAVSLHSRATPQCLEMGFRMLLLES